MLGIYQIDYIRAGAFGMTAVCIADTAEAAVALLELDNGYEAAGVMAAKIGDAVPDAEPCVVAHETL